MKDQADPVSAIPTEALNRIAQALEAMVPAVSAPDWLAFPAYVWEERKARGIVGIEAPPLALIRGINKQKQLVMENVRRHAQGHAAHDMLLWGARGAGKSALLRAAVIQAQQEWPGRLALVQIGTEAVNSLADLFGTLAPHDRKFLVFVDDLGFSASDDTGPRHLRSCLEGGVDARPANVRLAVTSNRRAILPRSMAEQDDPINPRDAVDDQLALADRFGLSLGFHVLTQDDFLDIVRGYAEHYGLDWNEGEALEWAKRRGARSGRVAWHFITELAGRANRAL